MKVFCPALLSGKYFPTKCARREVKGGQNVSPPLVWTDIPPGVMSFAISMVDRHPIANDWVHWLVANIPRETREIREGASRIRYAIPPGALEFRNSFGDMGYGGPQPPRGSGAHVYEITLYALSIEAIELGPYATLEELLEEISPHVVATAMTSGTFEQ
ncbi:MAG TPA: YbhB/YbcL family Raf kinase inhibitor-like protein [Bacteroidota bacterium]|nr:YbhB/YbcL family Raf kinase inhibitor-like protein [Bacteroidota bacterium]